VFDAAAFAQTWRISDSQGDSPGEILACAFRQRSINLAVASSILSGRMQDTPGG